MPSTITPHNLYWVLGEQELGPLEFYFAKALKKNDKKVNYINIHKLCSKKWKRLSLYSHRLPRKFDNTIQRKYFKIINDALLEIYKSEKPSHIFIYNDCKIMPETIEFFKKNGTKIIVFLGDDPNYLNTSKKTFLLTVMNADAVILPDTGWIDGLRLVGVENIIYSPLGTDTEVFFKTETNDEQKKKYGADILFVGTGYYLNSWGIRRAAILNELCNLNFKLFGDNLWLELFPYFSCLRKHFICEPLSAKEVNIACNCSKIYPICVNAGIINGVSTRVFDGIASEIFIIAEYRKDLDYLFPNGEIVYFHTKKELREKINYFLKNENEMEDHIDKSKKIVLEKYTLDISIRNILDQI